MLSGIYLIEQDLADTWVDDFAAQGLGEFEVLLAKHAAFQDFYKQWVSRR